MPWLLEPMAELSEPRLGAAVTSEAKTSREPYEFVPLNVESTYVAYIEGGAAAQGVCIRDVVDFFPRPRTSLYSASELKKRTEDKASVGIGGERDLLRTEILFSCALVLICEIGFTCQPWCSKLHN
jgi:hypothetical protein